MHELSIALAILDAAEEEAGRRGVQVIGIHLRLGALSGVVKEALESAFAIAREGTLLGEAWLVIEEVPVRMDCPVCRGERPVQSIQQLCCAACGTPARELVRGRELELVALEVQ